MSFSHQLPSFLRYALTTTPIAVTAVFPEMKTTLRTYHPVPSLQKTDGNVQDAPRIKNCLKAAILPSEFKSVPPSTPEEILQKTVNSDTYPYTYLIKLIYFPSQRSGQIPPTSVVNLIFVLANHATVKRVNVCPGTFAEDLYLSPAASKCSF